MQIDLFWKDFHILLLTFLLMEWYCGIMGTEICVHFCLGIQTAVLRESQICM